MLVLIFCLLSIAALTSCQAFSVMPSLSGAAGARHLSATPALSTLGSTPTAASFDFGDDTNERGSSSSSSSSSSEQQLYSHIDEARMQRYRKEAELIRSRFVQGDDLHTLRRQIFTLRQELATARGMGATDRVHELERTILKAQQVDAEFVYQVSLERMNFAKLQNNIQLEKKYKQEAILARSALPQFNLEGLWVGKFDNGFEIINITYSEETLIAYKVTTGANVPKGQVSFAVNLTAQLEPIQLGGDAVKQWGTKFLQRFAGKGQVASKGFRQRDWVEGQLILVNEYFSFAWLPLNHQVFFGRPSAELTLKLLRQNKSANSKGDKMREFLNKCWEETELVEEDLKMDEEERGCNGPESCFQ
jgi:hypothetical protein